MDVEVGYPLLLNDPVLLDRQCFGIPRNTDVAVGSWVKVVNLLPSLVADLGTSIGSFAGS